MKIKSVELAFGDLVVVTMDDGEVFRGVLFDYRSQDDSVSGYEEIGIRERIPARTLYVQEIESIDKVA